MKTAALVCLGLLALSLVPVSGHAAAARRLPGEKCGPAYDTVQIGTTTMAEDRQNIISCLETGEKTQDGKADSEWKAMTSSGGGGGITGGCGVHAVAGDISGNPSYLTSQAPWGKGCRQGKAPLAGPLTACDQMAATGYTCGAILSSSLDMGSWSCLCVKK